MFAMRFVGVLLAMTATDFAWATYTRYVAAGKKWHAALASAAIYGCGSLVTISYIDDHRMAAAALLGCVAGTLLAMRKAKPTPP